MPPVKRLDLSPKKREIVVTQRSEGYSLRETADKNGGGATPSGIRKLCKRLEDTDVVTTTKTDAERSAPARKLIEE